MTSASKISPQKFPQDGIRRPTGGEARVVVETLGDAFAGDPVMSWISDRPGYPQWVFGKAFPYFLTHNQAYMTTDFTGVALWLPPGVPASLPIGTGALWEAWRRFGAVSVRRMKSFARTTARHHPTGPHYYLFALGVRKECQGRGIGSALLDRVLSRCDRESAAAYLENSNERNLVLYERHGFKVMREVSLPPDGPAIWLMFREPGALRRKPPETG